MLLHDDVMAHRKAKPGSLTRRLGREERIEYLFFDLGRNAAAVVANADFNGASQVFRGRAEYRLKTRVAKLRLALGRRIKSVRDQVEEGAGDLLRKSLDRSCTRIEVALQGDIEPGFLGTRAVIGEIEALIEQRIDIRGPMFAGALARVQQHVLDDGVGALAMLDDLFEIVFQQPCQFVDFLPHLVAERGRLEHVVQFVGQFGRECCEIVDEIEWILDFVGNARGELSQRSKFLGLNQPILGGTQIVERGRELMGTLRNLLFQAGVGFLELAGHIIELIGERFQLVAGVDRDTLREIAGAEPGRALTQLPDRPQHPVGDETAGEQRDRDQQYSDPCHREYRLQQ